MLCIVIGLSLCCTGPVVWAAPLLGVRLHLPFLRRDVAATNGAEKRRHGAFLGAGGVTFTGNGSIDLGTRRSSLNSIGQSTTSYSSAMTVGVERRTQNAALTLTQGVGYNSGASSMGQLQANYRTPVYSVDYGPVGGGSGTQLQVGGFSRGVVLTKPRPNGDIQLIAAAALQQDNSGFRALGLRRSFVGRANAVTLTALAESAEHGAGTNRILDAVFKGYRQSGQLTLEVALANPHGVALAADGMQPAYAIGVDKTGRRGYVSLSAQDEPNGFTSLNTVSPPQRQIDLTLRRDFAGSSVGINAAVDAQRIPGGGATSDRRVSATYSATTKRGIGITLLDTIATSSTTGGSSTLNRTFGSIVTESVRGTSLSQTFQLATVNGTDGLAAIRQYGFTASRRALGGYVTASQAFGTTSSADAAGAFRDTEVGYTRQIGKKLDVSSEFSNVTQITNGLAARTLTLTTSLTRRFSNVVALRVTAARTHQTGAFTANGTSFSADLVGPLAFGAVARTDGKGNPNLPATVRGHVYLIPGNDFTAAAAQQRGFGNVLVILDNVQTQRTDATGEFEFRSLKAGQHSIAIETASLSAGLVADRQNQAFRVGGGQITTIDFGVGQFAGIAGRITTQTSGAVQPIPDVDVIVDDLQRARTGPDGRYSVGRLKAGAHKVAVVMESLPASVTFANAPVKTVQAVTGTVTSVDFAAAALGSIAGVVLYAPDNGFGDLRGARDVYVVANPGDHAVITGPDGAFLLDNLPAGTYTLSLDPQTLPDGQTAVQGPDGPLALLPGGKIEGVSFKLGTEAKEVVFTFNGAKKAAFSLTLDPSKAPPGALINVVARTSAKNVKRVGLESDLFAPFALVYDKLLDAWTGAFVAPERQKGEYGLQAALEGTEKNNAVATLAIDNAVPLVSVRTSPAKPRAGQTARIVAKILAPAEEGDELRFQDGYTVKLPKPKGRVFAFDIRVWAHGVPYAGTILSKKGAQTSFTVR